MFFQFCLFHIRIEVDGVWQFSSMPSGIISSYNDKNKTKIYEIKTNQTLIVRKLSAFISILTIKA